MSNEEGPETKSSEHGRYVQGEYGKGGSEEGHKAGDPEGRYVEGDYGRGGAEGAQSDDEAGRFVEADYGTAGVVPDRAAGKAKGRYVASSPEDENEVSD